MSAVPSPVPAPAAPASPTVETVRVQAATRQRILLPVLVAVVLLAAWQWWVVAFEIPKFLVPSPLDVAQTLVKDFPLLAGALWVTVMRSRAANMRGMLSW